MATDYSEILKQTETQLEQIRERRQQIEKAQREATLPTTRTKATAFTPRATRTAFSQRQKELSGVRSEFETEVKVAEQDIKDYQGEVKKAQEYESAYASVYRAYQKGMLWAIAAFGDGLERQIAKDMIKQGYRPNVGGELEQQRYKEGQELLSKLKEKGLIDYKSGRIFDTLTNKPVIIKDVTKKYNEIIKKDMESQLPEGSKPVYAGETLTGYELGGRSYGLEEQQRLYNKFKDIIPQAGFINISNKQFVQGDTNPALNENKFLQGVWKRAYLNPKTNKVFDTPAEYNEYIKTNKIPTIENGKQMDIKEFKKRLEGTYWDFKRMKEIPGELGLKEKAINYAKMIGNEWKNLPGDVNENRIALNVFVSNKLANLLKLGKITTISPGVYVFIDNNGKAFTFNSKRDEDMYKFLRKYGYKSYLYGDTEEYNQFIPESRTLAAQILSLANPGAGAVAGAFTTYQKEYVKGSSLQDILIAGGGTALSNYLIGKAPRWVAKGIGVGGLKGFVSGVTRMGTISFSKPISNMLSVGYQKVQKVLPYQQSQFGKFGSAALYYGLVDTLIPTAGYSYLAELGKGAAFQPKETLKGVGEFVYKEPGMLLGGMFGRLAGKGITYGLTYVNPFNRLGGKQVLSSQLENFNQRPRVEADLKIKNKGGRLGAVDKNTGLIDYLGGKVEKTGKYASWSDNKFRRFLYSATKGNKEAIAVLRKNLINELRQEAGIKTSDIISLKFKELYVGGVRSEMRYLFEVVLKEKTKLKAGSDVVKFTRLREGIYGQPTSRNVQGTPRFFGLFGRPIKPEIAYAMTKDYILGRSYKGSKLNIDLLTKKILGIKPSMTLQDVLKNKKIMAKIRTELRKTYRAEEVAKLTSKEALDNFLIVTSKGGLLFREGGIRILQKGDLRGLKPSEKLTFGYGSLYDRSGQKVFTSLTKILYKKYGKKVVDTYPLDKINDLLKLIPDIKQNDIIVYKNFIKKYYIPKKTIVMHLTPQQFAPRNLKEFFSGQRTIEASFNVRGSGKVAGTYISIPLYEKGMRGTRGQIKGQTLAYGSLSYLLPGSIYEKMPLKFTGENVKSPRPKIYYGKVEIKPDIFKLVGQMSFRRLRSYIESRVGTAQGTFNSLWNKESEAFLTDKTILVARKTGSTKIKGYNVDFMQFYIKKVNPSLKKYVLNKLDILNRNPKNSLNYINAANELKRITGIDHLQSTEINNIRLIELPRPKVGVVEKQENISERRIPRFIEFLRPIYKELPSKKTFEKYRPKFIESKKPKVFEQPSIKFMELVMPKFIEVPKPKIRERRIPKPFEVPKPKIVNQPFPKLIISNLLINKKIKKQVRKERKKKLITLPTAFEQLVRPITPKSRAKIKIRGFEVFRFR
jgi:hypothetical protein